MKEITVKQKGNIFKVIETNEMGKVITKWNVKKFRSITFYYGELSEVELTESSIEYFKKYHYSVLDMWIEQNHPYIRRAV